MQNENSDPTDYPVYIGDNNDDLVFEYHPLTGQKDSFHTGARTNSDLEVSADGSTLYIGVVDSVLAIDTRTRSRRTIFRGRNGILAVSPDNEAVAIARPGDELLILQPSTGDTIHRIITGEILSFAFPANVNLLYVCADSNQADPPKGPYIYSIDVETMEAQSTRIDGYGPVALSVSGDASIWYLVVPVTYNETYIAMYDVKLQQVVFERSFRPGNVNITLGKELPYLYTTNSESFISETPDPYLIARLNAADLSFSDAVSTIGIYGQDSVRQSLGAFRLAVTPDGKWLVATGWGDKVITIDVETFEPSRFDKINASGISQFLTCQRF